MLLCMSFVEYSFVTLFLKFYAKIDIRVAYLILYLSFSSVFLLSLSELTYVSQPLQYLMCQRQKRPISDFSFLS